MAAISTRASQRSGLPQLATATGAPETATRLISRNAEAGSAAYCTALNAVHRVERTTLPRERLELTLAQVGLGQARPTHVQEPVGRVEPGDGGAPFGGQVQRELRAVPSVEKPGAVGDTQLVERRLVQRRPDPLVELGPVLGGCAPQRALSFC